MNKLKRVIIIELLIGMMMVFVSCNKEEEVEQETKRPLSEVLAPSISEEEMKSYFDSEERTIWYFIDSYYEDGEKQTIDEYAAVEAIYVLENGNATLYHLDYEEFALEYLLGDLEKMTDSEIIELLDEHNQSDESRFKAIKEAELATGKLAVQQATLDEIEYTYVDGEVVEQNVKYSHIKGYYFDYIDLMRKFDTDLYKECSYISDSKGTTLTFSYKDALTIPMLVGMEMKCDDEGILHVVYKDIEDDEKIEDGVRDEHYGNGYTPNVYYIESKAIEDEVFTLADKQSKMSVGDSYYEGFIVENTNEYTGNVYKSGWLLKRVEE